MTMQKYNRISEKNITKNLISQEREDLIEENLSLEYLLDRINPNSELNNQYENLVRIMEEYD